VSSSEGDEGKRRISSRESGQQLGQRDAAGEGLRHGVHQRQVLGPGEQEAAGPGILVHQTLEIGEDLRHPLHLVDDGAVPIAGEEGDRVLLGELPPGRILQRHVGPVGKGHTAERRLARLAGAGEIENRIPRRQVEETRLENPLDHRVEDSGPCRLKV
jgi:hypothetical protein